MFTVTGGLFKQTLKSGRVSRYHGAVFDGVVALLQILELQLCDVVLRYAGTLCSDGVQQGAVAQHLLVQQLRRHKGDCVT